MADVRLHTPHKFRERLLVYGGAGAGKTNIVLQIARRLMIGNMHVLDSDYSRAYNRMLSTEFVDVDEAGTMMVHEIEEADWKSFLDGLEAIVTEADGETDDWLVIDSITPSWQWVQSWFQQTVHGEDLTAHLVKLRTENPDSTEYNKAVLDDMNWPLVKKEYARLYRIIQQWKGHLIITAEGKALARREGDEEKMLYGHLGFKPSGEGSLHHLCSTNLFLAHPKRGEWIMNTVKDRGREEVENMMVEDFAFDYLQGVAGWKPTIRKET